MLDFNFEFCAQQILKFASRFFFFPSFNCNLLFFTHFNLILNFYNCLLAFINHQYFIFCFTQLLYYHYFEFEIGFFFFLINFIWNHFLFITNFDYLCLKCYEYFYLHFSYQHLFKIVAVILYDGQKLLLAEFENSFQHPLASFDLSVLFKYFIRE